MINNLVKNLANNWVKTLATTSPLEGNRMDPRKNDTQTSGDHVTPAPTQFDLGKKMFNC